MKAGNLKPADYNPRRISDEKLAALRKSMEEFGDLSGIVVNVASGNLIGDHQRTKCFDPSWPIRKRKHEDACGTVAVGDIATPWGLWSYREVNWPREKEIAANIAANKHGGEFDDVKLQDLFSELKIADADMLVTGFSEKEIEHIFEQIPDTAASKEAPEEKITMNDVLEDNPKLTKFIEQRKKSRERGNDKNELNFWICLVFQSWEQKHEFLKQIPEIQVKYGMYVDGEAFADAVGMRVTPNHQKPFESRLDVALTERATK
jgi:hypothetical protein